MTTRAAATSRRPKPPATPGKGRLLPEEAARFLRRRMVEAGGLLIMLLGLAIALALATYDPTDPAPNKAVADAARPVTNLLGVAGAYLSDVLLFTLGVAAYLIAAIAVGWGFSVLRHRPPTRWAMRVLLGMVSVLLTAVALAGLSAATVKGALGGAAGMMLMSQLQKAVVGVAGSANATLLGVVVLLPALFALFGALGVAPSQIVGGVRGAVGRGAGLMGRTAGAAAGAAAGGAATGLGRLGGLAQRARGLATLRTGLLSRLGGLSAGLKRDGAAAEKPAARRFRAEPRLGGLGGPSRDEVPVRDEPRFAPRAGLRDPVDDGDDGNGDDLPPAEERRPRLAPVVLPKPKAAEPARKEVLRRQQPSLNLGEREDGVYELPPVDVLQLAPPGSRGADLDEAALQQNASLLESVLEDFGVRGEIVKVSPGPVVTLYELEPAPGTKSSRVIGLADDIARSMSAISVRVAVVPGRNVIGIEMPNRKRETVYFRELLETEAYSKTQAKLALVLGKDIAGAPVIADLARMPHLLVAGTTGSGKSVAINTMILSLLYRLPPDKCRFIMVDPKMLELSIYEGIPHLLAPVVTDPSKAVVALKWAVREMEDRYRAMSKLGVRNIDGYNARLKEARENGEVLTRRVQTGYDPDTGKPIEEEQPIDLTELPYIVVIVDEMADLMLVAGKDIEAAIQRLAQMARAAGIHIIMATQRPSVDVITGTIKANFPTRISFQVTSKIDSRTILGEQGAEQLLGQGDMLYMAGGGRITRVHGPFVRDEEVEEVVKFLKAQGEPQYVDAVTEEEDDTPFDPGNGGGGGGNEATGDDLYDQAVAVVTRERKASTSFIQRHLRIGYNSAARLIERMEKEGVVSKANHVGKREVLARDIDDHERVN